MDRFAPRHNPLRLIGRRFLLVLLLALVVIAVSGVWKVYSKAEESLALRREAEAQLADLDKRRAQLEADIAKLKTSRGMEEALREQYGLARIGERLIVIVESPAPAPVVATPSVIEWFQKTLSWWWGVLKGMTVFNGGVAHTAKNYRVFSLGLEKHKRDAAKAQYSRSLKVVNFVRFILREYSLVAERVPRRKLLRNSNEVNFPRMRD
jgi:cell division protein FtsB